MWILKNIYPWTALALLLWYNVHWKYISSILHRCCWLILKRDMGLPKGAAFKCNILQSLHLPLLLLLLLLHCSTLPKRNWCTQPMLIMQSMYTTIHTYLCLITVTYTHNPSCLRNVNWLRGSRKESGVDSLHQDSPLTSAVLHSDSTAQWTFWTPLDWMTNLKNAKLMQNLLHTATSCHLVWVHNTTAVHLVEETPMD